MLSASENPFKENLTSLPKPGGGEFGKFYSLPSLNDPRIGKLVSLFLFLFFFLFSPPTIFYWIGLYTTNYFMCQLYNYRSVNGIVSELQKREITLDLF